MAYLTKAQILSADDLKYEVVAVPEWGGEVRVKALTGKERDEYEAGMTVRKGADIKDLNLVNVRARLVALAMVDEQGKRLFSDAEVFDLGRKSAAALSRVFDVARKLSGISEEDVEELGKGLQNGHSDDSLTVSP